MRLRVSLARVMTLTDATPDIELAPQPKSLPSDAAGAVTIDSVRFGYAGGDGAVLNDASLEIPAGAKVGVVARRGRARPR